MNHTLKQLLTNTRIIILVVFLILAVFAINPQFGVEGVAIRSVVQNSSAAIAGIESPSPTAAPTSREVIITVNNLPVPTVEDYNNIVDAFTPNQTFTLETNKGFYRLVANPLIEITTLNETDKKISSSYF